MGINEQLKKEDYSEPSCLLVDPRTGERRCMQNIPLQRIIEKADEYCDRKDFAGAERHLKYWMLEAESLHDDRGRFSLYNEMMGFYRKQGRETDAKECAASALELMKQLDIENTVSGGTCYVNCGTVYDAFKDPERALEYFKRAEQVLAGCEYKDLFKMGSLYNNMALSLTDLARFKDAREYYEKALEMMRQVKDGELEQAITYLNMADAAAGEQGLDGAAEDIRGYLDIARDLLDTESLPRDGYYAFVCEKCAPGFYCYGYEEFGGELERRSEEIYREIQDMEQ